MFTITKSNKELDTQKYDKMLSEVNIKKLSFTRSYANREGEVS